MNWKALLNLIISAAVGGALNGLVSHATDSHAVTAEGLGGSVLAGAVVAVVQQLREKPELLNPEIK